jgi:predicted phosphodiesterase
MALCPECGTRPLSTNKVKRCLHCYHKRIGIKSVAKKNSCIDCKKELVGYTAKRCLTCYHRYASQRAEKIKEQKLLEEQKNIPTDLPQQIREPLATFEEGWARFQETIGMMKDRYKGPPKKKAHPSGRKRILVIPDLHVPFHEPEMVADMIAKESKDTDLAICIGDVGDAYALSRFAKYESVPYAYEWAEVTTVMQTLSESFPEVRIIVGNHDARLRKAIAAHLTSDMVEAISTMTGGTLCPLTALSRKYDNIEIAHHPVPNSDITIDWLTVEGDALLAHPEKYSRVPGSALRAFEEWSSDNSASIGLESIRLLVMGHTHQLAVLPWRSSSLLVECGCLCKTQAYMTGARIGGRPQRRGYVWFNQYDGITDLNSVGFRWYDVEKKS